MSAKTLMIQGTASHAGKSVAAAGFCRLFRRMGYSVVPFKAQNMSNNSYVTASGGEIGRAQAVQAEAACIPPTTDMNPILLKPTAGDCSQVVLNGRPYQNMSAREYQENAAFFLTHVTAALTRLLSAYDIVMIEGAGSPAEINLQECDIVNMRVAALADAPVLLVGDIERGGVFASLIGTLSCLAESDRKRIKGFLINKFRGDPALLQSGIIQLTDRTGLPTVGVLPFDERFRLPAEDSLSLEDLSADAARKSEKQVLIDVIYFPHISNFTDFAPLAESPGVRLSYLREVPDRFPDLCFLPGTKHTISDLDWLRKKGFEPWIAQCVRQGIPVAGICGGYQMLGEIIRDPNGVEGTASSVRGLGYLRAVTDFSREKATAQVEAVHIPSGIRIQAYEIHMGRTEGASTANPAFRITGRGGSASDAYDGGTARDGTVWGTYLHGLFDSSALRTHILNELRKRKGLHLAADTEGDTAHLRYERLADFLASHLDVKYVQTIMGLPTLAGAGRLDE